MNTQFGRISDLELGERLRVARESSKLTQAEAASVINVARTTLVAIEQGLRRIRITEIQKLAKAYSTSVNSLLRREAVHLDLVPQFRKLSSSTTQEVEAAGKLLNTLVSAELELENALGVVRIRNYPPERPILIGDVTSQAENDAQQLRDWLGLGLGPVNDVVSLLELQLGVRVFLRPLDSKISGIFAFDDMAGACILLNSNHPPERISLSGAHELGHLVATRRTPEALLFNERFISPEEKYADSFGRAFLTPARSVRQLFVDITSGQSHLTRRHIILLANTFRVSREAMVRRLEELSLARKGTWEWFQINGRITNAQAQEVIGDPIEIPANILRSRGLVPHRLALLARESSKQGIYSEGQLAQLLDLDRHAIREILDGLDSEASEANEQFEIPR